MNTENPMSDDLQGQDWQSRGPWLVVLLLPLAALAFRRGWLLSVVLVVGVLLPPQPAMAVGWDDLWQRADQQASKALAEQDYDRASQVAKDPLLRGSAEYRRGNYERALEAYSQANGTIADYNRGNALAKLGRYEEAIAAYEEALKSAPETMEDAQANKAAVEALLRQQQQQSDQSQEQQTEETEEGENSNNNERDSEESQQSESSSQDQQAGSGEQSESAEQAQQDTADQQEQQNKQGETPQDSDENTFADAAKALEEEQAEDASKQQEQNAGTASEKQAEQQPENNEPPPAQQTAQADDQPAHAQPLNSEEQMAAEQWLRRIPDDPGGLLRRKFQYQYQRRAQREGTGSAQPW